jgi:hypothetical protein
MIVWVAPNTDTLCPQEQYVFLHKALLDGLQGDDAAISESDFLTKVKVMLEDTAPLNQRRLYCEFKVC